MCRETTTSYRNCLLVSVHTVVCLSHIDHTRRQIDNAPCPKLKHEVINSDSRHCHCRDDGSCRRRVIAIWGDGNHSWSFVREGSDRVKIESMEQRAERHLKEILNEIRIKKNELSFLKHMEAEKNQANSKRRKKNDRPKEPQDDRPASEPPESTAAAGQRDAADAEMRDASTAVTLYNPATAGQAKKNRKICQLEREIDDLYQTWLARGGKEEGVENSMKPRNAPQRIKSDTYRPEREGGSNARPSGGRRGKPNQRERLERGHENMEDGASRSGPKRGAVGIKRVGATASDTTKVNQGMSDDVEME